MSDLPDYPKLLADMNKLCHRLEQDKKELTAEVDELKKDKDVCRSMYKRDTKRIAELTAEVERLKQYEAIAKEWIEKTEWIQNEISGYLGWHRADAVKAEVDLLRKERDEAYRQLEMIVRHTGRE